MRGNHGAGLASERAPELTAWHDRVGGGGGHQLATTPEDQGDPRAINPTRPAYNPQSATLPPQALKHLHRSSCHTLLPGGGEKGRGGGGEKGATLEVHPLATMWTSPTGEARGATRRET